MILIRLEIIEHKLEGEKKKCSSLMLSHVYDHLFTHLVHCKSYLQLTDTTHLIAQHSNYCSSSSTRYLSILYPIYCSLYSHPFEIHPSFQLYDTFYKLQIHPVLVQLIETWSNECRLNHQFLETVLPPLTLCRDSSMLLLLHVLVDIPVNRPEGIIS